MTKENKDVFDLSVKLRPYENMWVAISRESENIIGAEKTLALLLKKLAGKDNRQYEFIKVPDFRLSYAPYYEI